MQKLIKHTLLQSRDILDKFIEDERGMIAIEKSAQTMVASLKKGGKIISCGNGGSMADAIHFAEELSGKFREERAPLAAIAISDAGHLSCVANDYGFEKVFSRYVEGIGKKGDVLLAISTSGNSKNVINAALKASEKGMKVIALTGNTGGKLAQLADVEIRVPHKGYADRIQEIHIKIIHTLILLIEKEMF